MQYRSYYSNKSALIGESLYVIGKLNFLFSSRESYLEIVKKKFFIHGLTQNLTQDYQQTFYFVCKKQLQATLLHYVAASPENAINCKRTNGLTRSTQTHGIAIQRIDIQEEVYKIVLFYVSKTERAVQFYAARQGYLMQRLFDSELC